ncbi:MAG: hypothetical protein CL908_27310 [Deltaproteobacteria bacterium]|nr:hypothetical protein [Deltaproteobacteria bacterium]
MSFVPTFVVALAMVLTLIGSVSARSESEPSPPQPNASDGSEGSRTRPAPPPPLGARFSEPLEGEERFRLSYRFARVKSQGLLVSDRDIRPGQVRNDSFIPYVQTPRSLNVTSHTFRFAYAPHPRITLVAEVPFLEKELERLDASGSRPQDQSEGVGDLGFAIIVPFIRKGGESSHIHLGFDAPTGSIRRGGSGGRLPYDSQIGNGTWDFEWGWTYRGRFQWLSWGAQTVGRHPIGRNGRRYREGSRFESSVWGATRIFAGLSGSLRLEWEKQNNIQGRDRALDPIDDPSANSKTRGGTRFTLAPGLALDLPQLEGQRLSVEFGVPVHQDLDGPQLERDWTLEAGWQWEF